jgi:hypothetical protein
MNQTELRQLQNAVEVIGTLKSKNIVIKESLSGKKYISGRLVVQSLIDEKIHEQIIEVFTMESSKLFKGVETVMLDYKTIENDGMDVADRIKVRGTLKLKEYYNQNGNLVQYNEIRGMIFNRFEKNSIDEDRAIASVETVVQEFTPIIKNDIPTGEYYVNGFTVGWKSEVIELKNIYVSSELTQSFMDLYQPGMTGRLTFTFSNIVQQTNPPSTNGFGTSVDIEDSFSQPIKNETRIEVTGGDLPFIGGREYSNEQITLAKQLRNLKLSELKEKHSSRVAQSNNGFGYGASNQYENQVCGDINVFPEF